VSSFDVETAAQRPATLRPHQLPATLAAVQIAEDKTASDVTIGVRKSTGYLPELESLRGIACTLVALYHLDAYVCDTEGKAGLIASPLSAFILAGHAGVNMFFVLSAFLLSIPFLNEAAGGKRVPRRSYYARRALRILPLYYVAVIGGTILSAESPGDLLVGVPHLFFLNATTAFYTSGLMPYRGVWWTLGTEMQFYVLLPLLPMFLHTRRGRWLGAGVLTGYALAYLGYLYGFIRMKTILGEILLGLSLFGHAPLFLIGIAAAWVYLRYGDRIHHWMARSAVLRNGGADLTLFLTIAVLGYVLRWAAFRGFWGVEGGAPAHAWHLVDGGLWAVIILLTLLAPLRMKGLLSNRVTLRLGVLSYSIYLWHYPIFKFGIDAFRRIHSPEGPGWDPATLGAAAALCGLCVMGASLTYRFIERPFLAIKQRIR
jgi:peptidoglycan/LPS O-acetylase OafA/YrhL